MIILWISNMTFPEALCLLNGEGDLKASGGWMLGLANLISCIPNIQLHIASVSPSVSELTVLEGKRIKYYLLPLGKGNKRYNFEYERLWLKVHEIVKPDVVHLHGTEFSHGLSYLKACGSKNACVSIQGLVSACHCYFYYGISCNDIIKSSTPLSLIYGGILKGAKDFKKRGEVEKEIIRNVPHIIGRTTWDRERTWAINPRAEYHYCSEILRREFYEDLSWDYDKCTPHTIFVSQANYPIKGFHMLLRAMPLVLREFPDAKIRVAGGKICDVNSLIGLMKLSNYGNLIRRMIKQYDLKNSIEFLGPLNGAEMREEYLRCNVFVSPSTIENSPNSIGEAQMLGVPVLASYVGGVCDMMKGDEYHMYRFEETEMLAYKICEIFEKKKDIDTSKMQQEAQRRHNVDTIVNDLLQIYEHIYKENKD